MPHGKHLSLQQKVSYFQRSVRKDQTAIAFLESRRAPRTLERRSELGWYTRAYRWHQALLRQYSSKLHPVGHGVEAVKQIILSVFGVYGGQGVAVSSCETGGTFWPGATNGQYRGIFQMGTNERATYGDSSSARGQAEAAYRYFVASGSDWSPWECKP